MAPVRSLQNLGAESLTQFDSVRALRDRIQFEKAKSSAHDSARRLKNSNRMQSSDIVINVPEDFMCLVFTISVHPCPLTTLPFLIRFAGIVARPSQIS